MNMRLFSLCRKGENASVKLQIKIIGSLNNFADSDISFDEYSSLKDMFAGLSKALPESDFIVIAVAAPIYNSTKLKLMGALSLDSEENSAVAAKLANADMDDEAKKRNAAMPVGATAFLSADGLLSGFAVKKGKQTIAIIPLDDERTDAVLKRGLVPFITNGGILSQITEQPEEKAEPEPVAVEPKQEEAPKQQPVDSASYSQQETALRTLNILKEADVTIAINGNANSAVLRKFGETLDGFSDYFTFTPHIEDRGDYNVTDYTAQMAKSAKGLSKATLGACVSDIFTTDECDYICIAVATDKSALVRKLYKEETETDEQFVMVAAEELFALISEKASGNNAVGIEIAQEEAPQKKGFIHKKSGKITLSIISIVLVAAVVVGVLFFVKSKKNAEPETTAAPETQEVTEEPTTEAVVKTETMVLSQLIRYEAVNGIEKPETTTSTETTTAHAISASTTTTTTTAAQPETPSVITVNGEQLEAKEAIARIVEAEMDKSYSPEAIKAQAVVTYTYLKFRDTGWTINNLTIAPSYSQEVYDAVSAVFGHYLTYNSQVAFTPYCLMSAGKTASSQVIFGVKYDYLKNVDSSSDKQRDNYKQETLLTAEDIRNAVKAYDATITLGEDMSKWLSVTTHDAAISTGTGYVDKMQVGDKEVSGMTFICDIMKDKKLASPCMSIQYNSAEGTYTVTTFGSGFGVGMSQKGADKLAVAGTKYDKILDKYYPGTILA